MISQSLLNSLSQIRHQVQWITSLRTSLTACSPRDAIANDDEQDHCCSVDQGREEEGADHLEDFLQAPSITPLQHTPYQSQDGEEHLIKKIKRLKTCNNTIVPGLAAFCSGLQDVLPGQELNWDWEQSKLNENFFWNLEDNISVITQLDFFSRYNVFVVGGRAIYIFWCRNVLNEN